VIYLYHNYTILHIGRCQVYLRGEGLRWFLDKHPEYAPRRTKRGQFRELTDEL
jgi:hypothetical protein